MAPSVRPQTDWCCFRNGLTHVLVAGRSLCPGSVRSRLSAGGPRLLLGEEPLPLAQYWLRRLPPVEASLAGEVVRRLVTGAPVRRRLLVRREGRLFSAGQAELDQAAAGGDLVCRPAEHADEARHADVCVTYTLQDGEMAPSVTAAPFRTRLHINASADRAPEPRHALVAFGLACKETRQEGALELRVSCGGAALPVANVRTVDAGGGVVTTFDVDAVVACWAGSDDWRHAVRTDFTADGARLHLDSIHPPSYSLDMSFWLSGGAPVDEPFSWCRLRRALRAALGELLVSLELLDEYQQPDTGRRACTVRLQYQDLCGPLAYQTARQLHEEVLPEVLSNLLGVCGR